MTEKTTRKQNNPVKVYDDVSKARENEPQMTEGGQKTPKMSMREMAAQDTRFHLQPNPKASPAEMEPFPAPVMRALFAGCLVGLLLGIGWAALLLNDVVVVGGWEGLFSMTPFTFYVFWAVMGMAFGGFLAGTAAILLHPNHT